MNNDGIILATALGLSCAFFAAPSVASAQIGDRIPVPEHVYLEAERQVELFMSWARNGDPNHNRNLVQLTAI